VTDNIHRHFYQHIPSGECDRKITAVLEGSHWSVWIGPNKGPDIVNLLDFDGSGYGTSQEECERLREDLVVPDLGFDART